MLSWPEWVSAAAAAGMLSVVGWGNLMGKVVVGWVSDRIGVKASLTICSALGGIAMLWLLIARKVWMLYLFAAVFGFAFGGWMPMLAATTGELFGVGSLGAVFGAMQASTATAGTGGTIVGGYIFDVTQSYFLAFLLGAILCFAAAALVASARRPQRRRELA